MIQRCRRHLCLLATACTLPAHAMGAAHRTPTGRAAPSLNRRTWAPVATIRYRYRYIDIDRYTHTSIEWGGGSTAVRGSAGRGCVRDLESVCQFLLCASGTGRTCVRDGRVNPAKQIRPTQLKKTTVIKRLFAILQCNFRPLLASTISLFERQTRAAAHRWGCC